MTKIGKNTFLLLGLIVLIIVSGYFWSKTFSFFGSSLCVNEIIDSVDSPDGTKKVVVFVRDCGATTDWSTQASVIGAGDVLSDGETGNIFILGPDHGKAGPLAPQGWPIVIAEWEVPGTVFLYHSENGSISLQKNTFESLNIQYSSITPEIVKSKGIEVRPY